jgi:hypothetical protein
MTIILDIVHYLKIFQNTFRRINLFPLWDKKGKIPANLGPLEGHSRYHCNVRVYNLCGSQDINYKPL